MRLMCVATLPIADDFRLDAVDDDARESRKVSRSTGAKSRELSRFSVLFVAATFASCSRWIALRRVEREGLLDPRGDVGACSCLRVSQNAGHRVVVARGWDRTCDRGNARSQSSGRGTLFRWCRVVRRRHPFRGLSCPALRGSSCRWRGTSAIRPLPLRDGLASHKVARDLLPDEVVEGRSLLKESMT